MPLKNTSIHAFLRVNKGWKWLEKVPLATYQGGVFGQTLERDWESLETQIRIVLSCTSFTQVLRAMETGCYGAILPVMSSAFIDKQKFVRIDPPFLKEHQREVMLAWNPHLLKIKDSLINPLDDLKRVLAF